MNMRTVLSCFLTAMLCGAAMCAETSELWGAKGEKWKDDSRLPDFSFAGYHCGEKPLPKIEQVADVKQFGAKGDGTTDDSGAIQKAIDSTKSGAIFIPEGKYLLGEVVTISKSNIVLRGAGPDKTVLYMPKSLQNLHPKASSEEGKSPYAFSGGFITIQGTDKGGKIADVDAPAKRGDRVLNLSAVINIKPGEFIRLEMTDHEHTLGKYLHADQADAGVATYKEKKHFVDWVVRVVAVDGKKVTIDAPLRTDIRSEWKPEIFECKPTVQEVGIEDLAFVFSGIPKLAHLKEEGFNSIQLRGAWNSWVKNIKVTDADNGVIAGLCRFCTFDGSVFKEEKREGITGHHALWATGQSQECLFLNFKFETKYVHDLTVEGMASGNVFMKGSGVSIDFDHHRNAPYENLFTDIDTGDGKRIWDSSGREDRGPHSGARETFWNIRASKGKGTFPKVPSFPEINVVGLAGFTESKTPNKEWVEVGTIEPANLYDAMLQRRLKSQAK